MQPGDVFCGNDAYEGGGTHLPDIVLAEPIFVDGKITAWAVNLAHHADFADRGHAHIYQEGLRIPPVRLYRAGVLQTIVDPTILPNAGLARPLHVTAPEGTVVNCVHPAAVNGRLSLCQRIVDLIFGALAPAVPDRVIAAANGACFSITFSGHQPRDNALWVYLETIGGGSGARAAKDGLDGVHVHMTNTSNLPVEALELEYPLTLLRYELVDGSGGHGQFRGGMGLRRVYRAEAPCRVRVDGSRFLSSPWSLAGGEPGGRASVTLHGGAVPFDHGNGGLRKGESIEVVIAGGGGYGPAAKRDPAAVARDAAEGRV
jgi:N-methylhydantoinase B